jgi:hypothetical protein
LRDQNGEVSDDWFENAWEVVRDENAAQRQHTVIEMRLANQSGTEVGATVEIIGTVEAGYENFRWPIEPEIAIALAKFVSRRALDIRQVLLPYVLENIVKHAQHLLHADSASLLLV